MLDPIRLPPIDPDWSSEWRGTAFVDGAFVPLAEARVPLTDFGFTRSDATYDIAHVWNRRVFRLEDHLDRFERSLAALRLALAYDRAQIREIALDCARRSGLDHALVAMVATRGTPPPCSRDIRRCRNRFFAYAYPYVFIADPEQEDRGLAAVVSTRQRIPPEAVDPRIKNYHWLDMEMALFEAYDRGADVAILPDAEGNATEGPGFNVFAVIDGALETPDRGMLEGVSRLTALDLAAIEGLPVRIGPLPIDRLRQADEIFVTSTAGGIMPVTRLDGRIYGNGVAGPVTRRLRGLYRDKRDAGWHATPIDEATPVAGETTP
ncbi:MAG: branched-chain amino acid transferase [Alphaproteobacteria bacterium]|jgi:branched-chain amino acid aminotransferase|nr:branched-chain amino acid transferase [Alphaproteobacteria bacterium]